MGCYIPNSGQKLERLEYRTKTWDKALREFVLSLEKKKPVIVTGDMNVVHQDDDLFNVATNYNKVAGNCEGEKLNFTELLKNGYVDAYRALYPNTVKYSYFSYRGTSKKDKKGWRLDYFIVSHKLLDIVDDSMIRDDMIGSDHCPIVLTLFTGDKKRDIPLKIPDLPTSPVPKGYKGKTTSAPANNSSITSFMGKTKKEKEDKDDDKKDDNKKEDEKEEENKEEEEEEEKEEEPKQRPKRAAATRRPRRTARFDGDSDSDDDKYNRKKSNDDDEEDYDDDEDDDGKSKSKKKQQKKGRGRRAKKGSDDDDDEDYEKVSRKPKRKTAAKKSKAKNEEEEEEEKDKDTKMEEEEGENDDKSSKRKAEDDGESDEKEKKKAKKSKN